MGQVSQAEVFDMDHDGYDDIITLDTLGQLSIYYGRANKSFIYQFVDHVFDFAFAEKSLFSGSVYYEYPGFRFPDYTSTQDPFLRSQQEQLQSVLFSSVSIPDTSASQKPASSLGTQMAQSFAVDQNAGVGSSLANVSAEYNTLAAQYGSSLHISQSASAIKTYSLLKAPFIDKNILAISKKYSSLEKDGTIME